MKQVITVFAFLLLALTGRSQGEVYYCDDELVARLWPVGQLHNEGLDKVFEELKEALPKIPAGSKEGYAQAQELISSSVVRYVQNAVQPKGIDLSEMIKNATFPRLAQLDEPLLTLVGYGTPQVSEPSKQFTTAVQSLDEMINRTELPSEEEFRKLMRKFLPTLPSYGEKCGWIAGVSTAASTLLYWQENTPKWQELAATNGNTSTSKMGPGRKIGKADVTGAVKGAIWGGAAGAVGGTVLVPGAGTIGGAAAGAVVGGVGNGIKDSVNAAIDSFFDWLMGGD